MNDEEFDRRYLEYNGRSFWQKLGHEVFLSFFLIGLLAAMAGVFYAVGYAFYWMIS